MLNFTALFASAALAMAATSLFAAPAVSASDSDKPFLHKADLFEGETGRIFLYRIPGIVVTAKGTVLAYCEARVNSKADYGEIEIHLRRSTDGGKTFDKARHIAHTGERFESNPTGKPASDPMAREQLAGNPTMIADRDGTVHMVYQLQYERAFYIRSTDDGVTWSAPTEITSTFETFKPEVPWNVIATGPSHGIQLKTGRLLVPVWLATGPRGKHGPSVASTIFSDDGGKSWHRGDVVMPDKGEFKSPNESVVVELSDGRVMMNTRSPSERNRRLVAISPDGAKGWSEPKFDDTLWEPICAAGLVSMPTRPGTLIFSNPHNLKWDEEWKPVIGQGKRRNLSIKISPDDGKTWTSNRVLEEGTSAYSDLAVLPDGTILCFYERDLRLTLARFNLAWATSKTDN